MAFIFEDCILPAVQTITPWYLSADGLIIIFPTVSCSLTDIL